MLLKVFLFLIAAVGLQANQRYFNYCQTGGKSVVTTGVSGAPKVQASYPQCLVTVYHTGTLILATIYSDNSNTPKANPFTASTAGYFFFYAVNGRYDVTLSGGGLPAPITLGDVLLADPFSANSTVTGYLASDYDFTPQAPGGTLTSGVSAGVILSPCPFGVAGTDVGHSLYISQGSAGTAEAVLITGGTCTSGGLTGTIIFTPGNSHAGAWILGSASGGIQEAWNSLPSGTGKVILNPSGTIQVHAKITVPSGRSTLDGENLYNYAIQRASDYPDGNLLEFSAAAITTIQNMWIQNSTIAAQVSGAGLHYLTGSNATIKNVLVLGGYIGYDFDGTSSIYCTDVDFIGTASTIEGALIHDSAGTNPPVNTRWTGGSFANVSTSKGIVINAADLAQFTNLAFGSGTIQIDIALGAVVGNYISGIYLSNCSWDDARTSALRVSGVGVVQGIHITGGGGGGNVASSYGIDVGTAASGTVTDVTITGVVIAYFGDSGIAIGTSVTGVAITGNDIRANNRANGGGGGGIRLGGSAGSSDVVISGNVVTNNNGLFTGHQNWALGTVFAMVGLVVTGNDFRGNAASAVSINGALTDSIFANNSGLNDVFQNIAAAATVDIGTTLYPLIKLTGTNTTVTTITTYWASPTTITVINATSGSMTIGGGGNIPLAHTVPQNGSIALLFDGTNWY